MKHKNAPLLLALTLVITAILQVTPAVCAAAGERKLEKIGVQLYSLRSEAKEGGVEKMLKTVKELGYQQVELHTLYDMKASEFKGLLDKYGLQAPSSHRSYDLIRKDIAGTISDAKALQLDLVIIPWLDIKKYNTKSKWLAFAEDLNRIGKMLKSHGVRLAYHNHEFEFAALSDGSIPYDILVANTDPEFVALQLDLFWIAKAGKDPIPYFRENKGRIVSVHVKDMKKGGVMTEVGSGNIDFAEIFAVGVENGLQYLIVEHDNPKDPFASIKTSLNYLEKLTY